LTELTRLHLEKTAITDAALPNLAGLQKLEYLNLYGTNITDAGLEPLGGLAGLKKLFVWETKVTLDGVRKLRERLPELQIIGGPEEPKPAGPKEAVEAPKPAKT
ncbi:MAG: ribonuclease inhibitor, partial [Planctomycetota bacterium]|nr:ribonuclease inhibitor [Planctomycetota bacterium]